ncbi:hypothetical protein V496_06980 [Pseudogymnoascus sp. VKM F-4515 (FW-2607)]|nr:hypothetical protein V496_06980 [Pseudogymnoascus sp. VKM F-4515 (FW-2607)]KFY91225.1 hypothetical protein V498_05579 [Pseudogymnoascus sp. VKM F-4517 (FW-2822)]
MILSPRLYLGIFAPPFCPRAAAPALSHPFTNTTHHYSPPTMLRHRPIQIVLDFDGTITTKDTIEPLVQSAIAIQHPSLSPSELSQTPEAETWSNCKSQYLADLAAHYEKENQEPNDGVAVTGPSALEREQRSLNALRDVEWASVQRVGESGVFKGVSREAFREIGKAAASGDPQCGDERVVVVREGFVEFVRWIEQSRVQWGVVSVNWSWRWVRGVLDEALSDDGGGGTMAVKANDADGSTGMIIGYPLHKLNRKRTHILTTADKLFAQKITLFYFDLGYDSPEPLTVYIGDSPTDLSSLLHADIGIIMNPASSTPGALSVLIEKCGYRILPVSEYKGLYHKGESEDVAILLSINNFAEIKDSGMLQDEEWDPTAAKEAWKKEESMD